MRHFVLEQTKRKKGVEMFESGNLSKGMAESRRIVIIRTDFVGSDLNGSNSTDYYERIEKYKVIRLNGIDASQVICDHF